MNIFSWLGKKPALDKNLSEITFTIDGMHCASCSLNIDGALEDLEGVESAETSYRSGKTKVVFRPSLVEEKILRKTISELGYTVASKN